MIVWLYDRGSWLKLEIPIFLLKNPLEYSMYNEVINKAEMVRISKQYGHITHMYAFKPPA